jgi:peptide/nickel transport system substrate-binding protein
MPNRRIRTTSLFSLIALVAISACSDSGALNRSDRATLFFWQAPSTMNPYLTGGLKELAVASIVIESLAEYDDEGTLAPTLAAEIPSLANGGIAADYRSITWTLKPDILWSDGTPFTAHDVVFSWRFCAELPGCSLATQYDGVESVEAIDVHTVEITFASPKPFPFAPFVTYASPILQRAQFANCLGDAAIYCTEENFHPVGTGPYRVAEFRTNDIVLLAANPYYRGRDAGLPRFSEVVIKGGGSATAAARSVLQLGEADFAWNLQVEPLILEAMSEGGHGEVATAFAANVELLFLNQTNPARELGDRRSDYDDGNNPHPFLNDPVVGRALSLAIDRQALVDIGYGDAGRPTCNVWPAPPEQASTNNDECLMQNIELANRLLDDAGIVDTDGDGVRERNGVPLSILYQTSTNGVRQITQDLIKGWWAQIGVDTELKNVSGSVFFGQDASSPDTLGKFYADIEMFSIISIGKNPYGILGRYVEDKIPTSANDFGGQNVPRYQSDAYEALYGELLQEADPDRRSEIIIALNDMLVQSYAIIPLIHRAAVSGHHSDLDGVSISGWDSELWNIETWSRKP